MNDARQRTERVYPSDVPPRSCVGMLGPQEKPIEAVLLEVRDLSVRFNKGRASVSVVNGLSYRVRAGRALAIVGESGSGKSVSCRSLVGLLPKNAVASGSVRFAGRELLGLTEADMQRYRGAEIAMVFQDLDNALNPTMRVGKQIGEAIRLHTGLDRSSLRQRTIELLRALKMPAPEERIDAYPHELSGGMKQRVLLAMALAGNPKLLIADESTRALDATTQCEIVRLIGELQRQRGMAVILISHDLRLASSFADDTLVMQAGSAIEYAATPALFAQPRTPYARTLLQAIPGWDGPRMAQPRHRACPTNSRKLHEDG